MKKMRKYKMYEILDAITNNGNEEYYRQLSITIDASYTSHELKPHLVIQDSTIYNLLWHRYNDYTCVLYTDSSGEQLCINFLKLWQLYVTANMDNWGNMVSALYAVYDPISNYDMQESYTDGHKRDNMSSEVDMSHKFASGNKQSNYTDTTNYSDRDTDTTHYVNGFDDNNFQSGVPSDRTNTTEKGTETHSVSYDNNINIDEVTEGGGTGLRDDNLTSYVRTREKNEGNTTSRFDNSLALDSAGGNIDTETKYNSVDTHYMTRKGNIGVTTSQQMISSEIELRKFNIIEDIVDKFAEQYLYYVSSGDDDYDDSIWCY